MSIVGAYNDDPQCPGENIPQQPPACANRISSASTWQTVAVVGYAIGGALALAGAVVFLTAPRRASGPIATTCAPAFGNAAGAFVCAARF